MDWYLKFAWLLVLISSLVILTHYNINNINSCTSDPLNYGMDKIKFMYGDSFNYSGSISIMGKYQGFIIPIGEEKNITIIYDKWNNNIFLKNISI